MKAGRAEYAVIAVTIIAAAGWLFSKNALQDLPPYTFIGLRFSIAAAVLALFCLPQLRLLTRKQWLRSASAGCALGFTLLFWVLGLDKTTSIAEGAFIVSLSVVLVPVMGRVLYAEAIPRIFVFAIVPALAGLTLLTVDSGFTIEVGQWYFLAATIGFALHLNLSSHFVSNIPSLANTSVQLATVGITATAVAMFTESWPTNVAALAWVWVLASAIIGTSFRFALQNRALQFMSPTHASMIMLLEPIWTALLGIFILGEDLSNNKLAGCALIFTALLVFRSRAIMDFLRPSTRTKKG